MRTLRVSDQTYEQLKSLIVDPFDDTPEIVIGRLIEIVNKAKARWASFEAPQAAPQAAREAAPEAEPPAKPRRREHEVHEEEESTVVL
jgi:hypothetical protein